MRRYPTMWTVAHLLQHIRNGAQVEVHGEYVPARDAKDMRAMVRRAMNAEWCGRIMADCLLVGTDYGEEMMEAALKAAMAEESRNG